MKRDAHLSMRLPEEIVTELDAEAADLEGRTPGMRVTRADVARSWLMAGREAFQKAKKPTKKEQPERAA